jgi:hypothetical protein
MRKLILLALIAASHLAAAGESDKKGQELGQWHPLQATYMIHSGGTAYAKAPTGTDRAITVHFNGEAAQQLFDQMGPDVKETCSDAAGDRERRSKGAFCTYTAQLQNPQNSHYRCWIGIDLRTGSGSARVSC